MSDARTILTGADLQLMLHNSREGNPTALDTTVHVCLYGPALRILTKILRPLRATRSSQDSSLSLIGMSVRHESAPTILGTQRASSTRSQLPTRRPLCEHIGVETVTSLDGTAPHVVPMTSAPRHQVSSILQAHSGNTSSRQSDAYPNPGDDRFPNFQRWLNAQNEQEQQELAE
jgi:hypothetical protein